MESRRLFLAILLSLAVLVGWQYLVGPPEPPPAGEPEQGEVADRVEEPTAPGRVAGTREEAEPAEADSVEVSEGERMEAAGEERFVVETDLVRAEFTNRGAQLISFVLKEHETTAGAPLDLVRRRADPPYPFALVADSGEPHRLSDVLFVGERLSGQGRRSITFTYRGSEGEAQKRFTLLDNGLFEVELSVVGSDDWGLLIGPGLRNPTQTELESRFERRAAVYRRGDEVERVEAGDLEQTETIAGRGLRWVGVEDNYFLAAVLFEGPEGELREVRAEPMLILRGEEGEPARFRRMAASGGLSEQAEELPRDLRLILKPEGGSLSALAYWGAKRYQRLRTLPGDLEETVNLGIFRVISAPLLLGLHWTHDNVVSNYGWAIVLMTLLIKLLLLPLTHKSYQSMRKMQELNPKLQALRSKYKPKLRDKQGRPNAEAQRKMNEEMMALYKQEGVNPASGCLPMLVQLPVLFAFYRLLTAAVELRNAPWLLWIQDLSAADPYYVLPIVMSGTQFLQQRMTPAAGDPMQRRIFQMMPVVMLFIFLGMPSGLVLYWLTNNVLTIAQQWIYNHLKTRGQSEEKPAKGEKAKKARGGGSK